MRLPQIITNWLATRANKIARSRPQDFTVGAASDPYMLRWWVIPRNKVFNIYLHNFIRSDDDEALHDHPWAFNLSIIVHKEYIEHTIARGGVNLRRLFPAGTLKLRIGPAAHRVELTKGPVWTFFITGPVIREWGFHCPRGWKPWKEYAAVREGGNAKGVGCG